MKITSYHQISGANCSFSSQFFHLFFLLHEHMLQLVSLIAICSGNKEQHQSIFYVGTLVLNRFLKKTPIDLAFTKCKVFFFNQLCQSELRGKRRRTQAKMNGRNITKNSCQSISQCKNLSYTQCLLVFTLAWTYKIYRICLPRTQKINSVSYSEYHIQDKQKEEEEDEFYNKINRILLPSFSHIDCHFLFLLHTWLQGLKLAPAKCRYLVAKK